MEVEVSENHGLYLSRELLDFGILKSGGEREEEREGEGGGGREGGREMFSKCSCHFISISFSPETKSLPLFVLNTGPHTVHIKVWK